MAVTVVSQNNSEGVVNIATGKLTTDAAAATAYTLNLGFVPRFFQIVNITDVLSDTWMDGMAANTALHNVGSTGVTTATTGITNNNDGTVTIAAAIMIASKTFHFLAEA
jgi:hypothetical protein